jgi:hypothetical protein
VFVECVDQLAKRRSDFHEDRISVEYVDQLAQRRSDFQADRVFVECVNQLAQRRSDFHADRVSAECIDVRSIRKSDRACRPACPAPLCRNSSNDRIASHRRTSHTKNTDYSSSHRRFRRQLMSTVLALTWFPRPTCSRRASLFSLVE